MESVINSWSGHFEMFTQSGNAVSNTADRKYNICPSVAGLLNACGPANVAQFVIAVVVYSFKTPPALAFANVFKKVQKRFPTLAHFDAPSAVVLVSRISAPAKHSPPHLVNSGMGHAVPEVSSDSCFSGQATARSGASFKDVIPDYAGVPAITDAKASGIFLSIAPDVWLRFSDYFKPSKFLSNKADFCRHCIGSFSAMLVAGVRRQPALAAILNQRQRGYNN